jgi:membrane associated rhomboid family serine protease
VVRPNEDFRRARTVVAIAGVTGAVWLLSLSLPLDYLALRGGFIPARVDGGTWPGLPVWLTPLSTTLLHTGFIHLLFNLMFLLICGRAVEPILGPKNVAALYLIGAFAAAAAQWAASPGTQVPMIGASGAVSAVIGAYAMLFGRQKVRVANPTLGLWLNAMWLAAAWVGLQLLIGFTDAMSPGPRTAIAAHIGGFLVGLLLAKPLLLLRWRGA